MGKAGRLTSISCPTPSFTVQPNPCFLMVTDFLKPAPAPSPVPVLPNACPPPPQQCLHSATYAPLAASSLLPPLTVPHVSSPGTKHMVALPPAELHTNSFAAVVAPVPGCWICCYHCCCDMGRSEPELLYAPCPGLKWGWSCS